MTPGIDDETAEGMSEAKIEEIIEQMRGERYRFTPVRRNASGFKAKRLSVGSASGCAV